VNVEEISSLAKRLGLGIEEFRRNYTRRARGKTTLIEREGGDCIFWRKKEGCTVYEDRPRQCRTWPFWNSNLETPSTWDDTTKVCPGAGKGQLFTVEEIMKQSNIIDV
jgi:Fe-S-cluster containining protein